MHKADMKIYPYGGTSHHVNKLMRDIDFPVAKADLRRLLGDKPVPIDFCRTVLFAELLEKIPVERFPTATSFYCALHSIL